MNAVTPFVFEDNLVRTVQQAGRPWFVGKDVCRCLEIKNPNDAFRRLDDDEKGVGSADTLGGEQTVTIVSEPGVYRLIFTSRRPEAERFKRWLAHEVLPALRKTGQYRMSEDRPAPHNPSLVTSEAIPVLQTSLAMVREARHLYGHERARALWGKLGLPVMPHDPHVGTWAAADLLQIILMGKHEGEALEHWLKLGLEGDAPATAAAKRGGI
jgi:prophage antirepressor-like protein